MSNKFDATEARMGLENLHGTISRGDGFEADRELERLKPLAEKSTLPAFNRKAIQDMQDALNKEGLPKVSYQIIKIIDKMDAEIGANPSGRILSPE
jgi:hypothetical protein